MKKFYPYLFNALLVLMSISTGMAQDSTKRTPVQKPAIVKPGPGIAISKPGNNLGIAAKKSPAKPNVWAQVQALSDSLKNQKRKNSEAATKINAQSKTIASLTDSLKTKDQSLQESQETRNVDFLGNTMPFDTYNLILLGAVLFFALAFGFVVFRSASYRNEAKYRINLFKELSEEYQAHKMKANEKEKKLARELQDERNKIEEMKGR